MKSLTVTPIQTEVFHTGQDLVEFILRHLPYPLTNGSVLAVTSKIVSLAERRLVSKEAHDKQALIRQEADQYLGEIAYGCSLTIKHGLLIPSAGIDESNAETGEYILFPVDPFASAEKLNLALRGHFQIQKLGILITDSHTMPLRHGVTGIGLAYWGFRGVRNLIGSPDLFGRPLKMTQMDLVDGLAAAAVMMMGEAAECCPLAVIHNPPVEFCDTMNPNEVRIPMEKDLYYPIYQQLINRDNS